MGTGYTRNDTTNNIADGNVINAADLDGEFDAIVTALSTGGHTHDGTAAEGGPVTVLGPAQDFVVTASIVSPKTDNTLDLGTSTLEFKDIYIDGTAYIDGLGEDILVAGTSKIQFTNTSNYIHSASAGNIDLVAATEIHLTATTINMDGAADISGNLGVGGNLTVTGTTTFNGGTITLGDAAADNIVFGADVDSSIIPDDDDTYDLGSSGQQWRDIYIDGSAYIDGLAEDILVATDKKIQFRDTDIHISSTADGDLSIAADDEIDLTSTLIDINGNVEISGTTAQVGVLTTTAGITSGSNIVSDTDSTDDLGTTSVRWANLYVDAITATDQITATGFTGTLDGILGSGAAAAATVTTLDTSGAVNLNLVTDSTSSTSGALIVDGGVGIAKKLFVGTDLDVDGTTNLDAVDIDGAVDMASTLAVTGIATFTDDIIIGDGKTIGSASDVDAIAIGADGDVTLTQDLELQHDGAILSFGANDEITVTHVADRGLTITNINTGDNKPIVLQLKSEEDIMQANELIASIEFAAGDSDGTDGATIAAGIHAIAEDDFSGTVNTTKLVFTTGASETAAFGATAKMTLSSAGLLTIADDFMIKDGGTIGVASTNDAITIASTGIVTFKDDILIKDGGTIGSASDVDAMSISSGGVVNFSARPTFAASLTIQDGGSLGSASDLNAMTISSGGVVAVTATTASTSSTTGALTVGGGLGVAADLFVGDDFDVTGDAVIDGTALVTGVLTTTAATVFNGGFTANAASTITTADNLDTLSLISTDADAGIGPNLLFYRNSANPADNDLLTEIDFRGRNDNNQDVNYVSILSKLMDVTDGEEDGNLIVQVMTAGTLDPSFMINPTETVFNNDHIDRNFRVASDGNNNMLFVDGGDNQVRIGRSADVDGFNLVVGTTTAAGAIAVVGRADDISQVIFYEADASTTIGKIDARNSLFNIGAVANVPVGIIVNNSQMATFGAEHLTIGNGNLIIGTAGHGIDFSAQTQSSATTGSEVLDHYEEGTFTPVIDGSTTSGTYELVNAIGRYTRVGGLLHVEYLITTASSISAGGAGYLRLSGLPFVYPTGAAKNVQATVLTGGVAFTGSYLMSVHDSSGAAGTMFFSGIGNDGSNNTVAIGAIGANDTLRGSFSYMLNNP